MMKVASALLIAVCFGSGARAAPPSRFGHVGGGGRDLGAVHAPAPAPGFIAEGGVAITTGAHGRRATVCKKKKEDEKKKDKKDKKEKDDKKDKKEKKDDKKKDDKKKDDKKKKKDDRNLNILEENEMTQEKEAPPPPPDKENPLNRVDGVICDAEGRVHIRDSCESDEDVQVEVLVVEYNYTLQKEDDDDLDSVVGETEEMIHGAIVKQMNCGDLEGPVQNLRRRLFGISQSSRQLDGLDEHLRVVGVDPAPEDRKSEFDFCSPDDDKCVSINGFVTLLLEGDVMDDEQVAHDKEDTAVTTRSLIASAMANSQRVSLVDAPVLGSSRYEQPSGQASKQSVDESSSSIGAVLAGVLAAGLVVAGAFFVHKKTRNGEPILSGMRSTSGGGGVSGGSSDVPIASAKLFKSGDDSASVPVATVVEVDVSQSAPSSNRSQSAPPSTYAAPAASDPGIDKSRLRTNFGVSAVAM